MQSVQVVSPRMAKLQEMWLARRARASVAMRASLAASEAAQRASASSSAASMESAHAAAAAERCIVRTEII